MRVWVYAWMYTYVYYIFKDKLKLLHGIKLAVLGATVLKCLSAGFFFFMSSVSCLITLILKLPPSTDTKMVSPSSLETDSFDYGLSWLSLSADIKKLLHTYHYLQWHEKSQEVMSYEEDSSDVCFIHCFILEPSTVSSDSRHTITNEWTDG